MSVAGCYTDFHLDFGGTSVWYHVLKGEKIFFLIPPSLAAYSRFEEWQRCGQQEKTFLPDIVETCTLVHLKEGDTLLLPSGTYLIHVISMCVCTVKSCLWNSFKVAYTESVQFFIHNDSIQLVVTEGC